MRKGIPIIERKKVFCKDCTFFVWREEHGQRQATCLHEHAQQMSEDWYGARISPAVRNAEQDCPDYRQPPWWERHGADVGCIGTLLGVFLMLLGMAV